MGFSVSIQYQHPGEGFLPSFNFTPLQYTQVLTVRQYKYKSSIFKSNIHIFSVQSKIQ